MIPSFTSSQNLSKSPSVTHFMPPPRRPSPVELVVKLAKRSFNYQTTSISDSLWSSNELKWIAEQMPSAQTTFVPWSVEELQKNPKTTRKRRIGAIKSRNSNLHWSKEEINTLNALYKKRLSIEEIAAQLGRSKNACSQKLTLTKPKGMGDRRAFNLTPQGREKEKEAAIALTLLGK